MSSFDDEAAASAQTASAEAVAEPIQVSSTSSGGDSASGGGIAPVLPPTSSSQVSGLEGVDDSRFQFFPIECALESMKSADRKEMLLQWNVDACLSVKRFRFAGHLLKSSTQDYLTLVKELFYSTVFRSECDIGGSLKSDEVNLQELSINAMSMTFFDFLKEADIVSASGTIRGCFDEDFDGITVGDQMRELLCNEDSERACFVSSSQKNELIYHLFKIFAVGGAMCQPDAKIDRYLETTKLFYKDILTIFKDSNTGAPTISGKAFKIHEHGNEGIHMFPVKDNRHNTLIVLVDPLKKWVTVIKNTFKSFW